MKGAWKLLVSNGSLGKIQVIINSLWKGLFLLLLSFREEDRNVPVIIFRITEAKKDHLAHSITLKNTILHIKFEEPPENGYFLIIHREKIK